MSTPLEKATLTDALVTLEFVEQGMQRVRKDLAGALLPTALVTAADDQLKKLREALEARLGIEKKK